jgi:3'-phosphoadenosine 5'-phosphosulfate (PAPS) 3'-phosphatase
LAARSPTINVMAGAALKAARALKRDFGEVEQLQVSVKGPSDFVSTADLHAERTLKTELMRARPGKLNPEICEVEDGDEPNHPPQIVVSAYRRHAAMVASISGRPPGFSPAGRGPLTDANETPASPPGTEGAGR